MRNNKLDDTDVIQRERRKIYLISGMLIVCTYLHFQGYEIKETNAGKCLKGT